jgi:hypothetical protein
MAAGRHRAQDVGPGDQHRAETENQMNEQERRTFEDTQHRLSTGDWTTPDRRTK